MLRLNQNETIPIFISKIGVLNNNNREVGMNGYLSPPPKKKNKTKKDLHVFYNSPFFKV